MVNRCPHIDEGILPILNKKIYFCLLTTSMLWAIIFLILLPRTSLAVATKYETAYACEGKTLTIECERGNLISLIRANYGRFSITICNDHGNVDWSVNCMSPKSLIVLNSKCANKENCSVLASTNMFGDPCTGTHKYLEAHYQCISAIQTITTTRPSPSWLLTRNPSLLLASSSSSSTNNYIWSTISTTTNTLQVTSSTSILNNDKKQSNDNNNDGDIIKYKLPSNINTNSNNSNNEIHLAGRPPNIPISSSNNNDISNSNNNNNNQIYRSSNINDKIKNSNHNDEIDNGIFIKGSSSIQNSTNILINNKQQNQQQSTTIFSNNNNKIFGDDTSKLNNDSSNNRINDLSTIYLANNNNKIDGNIGNNNSNINDYYCGPTTLRNLFWNLTKVGEVNVQPCPGGATGIAKWRCILIPKYLNQLNNNNHNLKKQQNIIQDILLDQQQQQDINNNIDLIKTNNCDKIINIDGNLNNNCDKLFNGNSISIWYPKTPDLTQCRSLWLNNLEISVNQHDSSLISIANDLSQVTSSKILYGGDMLVTTKIIQTISEKMSYDIETFPDQRQREAIIKELLLSVVKISSNLLDKSQHLSWLDLSFEDQMRVATSLLTGLEYNAFLLADSTIREKDVLQSVKNILLSVRVVETRNVAEYEIFPDSKRGEYWSISDDRIELPRGALIENKQQDELIRIVFVAFDRLETILKPSYDNLDLKISKNLLENNTNLVQRARILNSKVISASLGKGRHIQLSQPIKLILKHLKLENVSNPTCVYWNYIDHAWSSDGCFLETTNYTHSICMCNHLTNFAILMDIIDEHQISLLSMFDKKLRIFIYISISICILFIVIAILTLKLFNAAFIKSTRTSIYKNIYVCLFIIEILFLLGVEQNETSLLCGFTTAFLHCFILSAIAWLFFEGFQLYVTLTTDDMLLEIENSSKIIWYYLLSYGLSFTIVAISLAIDPGTYTQSDYCVLMESNPLFYTTFMSPIILFMIGAICYTILAGYTMFKKNKLPIKNKEHSRLAIVRFDLRCSFIFLIILSADWIFAYLYLRKIHKNDKLSYTYGYLFVIFNSLLGIYIFIFHCIQNEKIRREYRKYIRQKSWLPKCLRCSKTSSISSSSAVSQHHHHQQQQQQQQQQQSNIQQQQIHYNATNSGTAGGVGGYKKSPISNDQLNDIGDITIVNANSGLTKSNNNCDDGITTTSVNDKTSGHIILERGLSGSGGVTNVLRTPSCGHTSPTSSAGSTHLIFTPKQQQQQQYTEQQQQKQNWNYIQSSSSSPHPEYYTTNINKLDNKNLNTYDDKFIHYDCKSKRLKNHPNNLLLSSSTTPRNLLGITGNISSNHLQQQQPIQQQHEYFYWTEKSNNKKKQLNNSDIKYNKNDIVNCINGNNNVNNKFYPSYKKTTTIMRHYQQQQHDNDKLSDCEYPLNIEHDHINKKYYQQHNNYRYNNQKYQLQQNDDDNCSGNSGIIDSSLSSNQHLITPSNCLNNCGNGGGDSSCGGGGSLSIASSSHQSDCFQSPSSSYHQHYRHKHSNCDLTNEMNLNCGIIGIGDGGDSYYNHQSINDGNSCIDEPVYEEILNSTMSDGCNADNDGDIDNDDDDDNELNCILDDEQYNKIRRMISNKDDRQQFYRSDIKQPLGIGKNIDINNTLGQISTDISINKNNSSNNKKKHQQKKNQKIIPTTTTTGGGGVGIVSSILPQNSITQSTRICLDDKNNSSSSSNSGGGGGVINQHQIVGRNISAMLDENNTVVCYLEPLTK